MRVVVPILAALLLVASLAAPAAANSEHARHYYLSLGDSLAAGVQPIGDADDLYRTDEGYAEQLLAIARQSDRKLSLQKLGCPGETTTSLRFGGICDYPHGSQLDEAVAFLKGHADRVAFITIDIGPNDFPCNSMECAPQGIAAVSANLPVILQTLREAIGPGVPIVGMTIYNPLLAAWLMGPEGQLFARGPATDTMGQLNALFTGLYAASNVPVADVAGAFASTDFETMVSVPGYGQLPISVARVCAWTWACTPPPLGPDNHANAAGYGVIARAFAAVLGL